MLWREAIAPRFQHARLRLAAEWRTLTIGMVLFVVAALAFGRARSAAGFWGIDDAAVTYAAAFQLADHGTLATYVEGTPVEGYSNPIVFFVVTALRVFRLFDPIITHVHLEALVFAWMVVLVWWLLRSRAGDVAALVAAIVFGAVELITPATWIWYGSGLENVWVSAGLVQLLWLCERTARGVSLSSASGAIAFAVALTRPEAPVYVAAFYGALIVFCRPSGQTWAEFGRRVGRALATTVALYALFLAWRRIGYGDWLPNTYYAKLSSKPDLARHLREYVVGGILPYGRSALFAGTVLALLVAPTMQGLAPAMLVLLVAALALPITAGADWMGEHRFATPFLAMCHASYAALVAVCVSGVTQIRPRNLNAVRILAATAVFVIPVLLTFDHIAVRDPIPLHDVTIARVAELQGGARWEQQARLGVPNAVVLLPDAGGSLLVGGMQLVDNGYLTDFQMARLGRNFANPADLRALDQYEVEERRPDLVDPNPNWPFDHSYVGKLYLAGPGARLARRDLVEVDAIDPATPPLYDDGRLRLYLSDETVATAAPGALVRCEIIVAWSGGAPDANTRIRAHVDEGDSDEISLAPYERKPAGIERRALLLGAPSRTGAFSVSLEILQHDAVTFGRRLFTLDVTRDERVYAHVASELLKGSSPIGVARRLAALRDQLLPRLGMTAFHNLLQALLQSHAANARSAGPQLMQLRWQARLAAFARLPSSIRDAEATAAHRLLATCADDGDRPKRVLCIGRAIDELRRYGYLGVLAREPAIAKELGEARRRLDGVLPAARYRTLVGLTLAIPADIGMQRALLEQRRDLHDYPAL